MAEDITARDGNWWFQQACIAAGRARDAEIAGDDYLVEKYDAEYMDCLMKSNDAFVQEHAKRAQGEQS